MSRLAVAILLALALSQTCRVCEAGVLDFLGEKTQQLRNETRVVVEEAEKRIKGLFGRVDEEPPATPQTARPEPAKPPQPAQPQPARPQATSEASPASELSEEELTTTVAPRDLFRIVPRCEGNEIWDKDTMSCIAEA